MALQILQHLQGRALADIVDVFFIRQAVQADAAGICDAALTHDVCDAGPGRIPAWSRSSGGRI